MAHDVFISYSTHDKTVADAVCGTLENRGIRCWIAPRDIPPGKSWPAAIVEAISSSKVFVLVFSNGSNQSRQVFNEVGEAFDNEIPIVPFRIEEVEPSQEMGYFIKTTHWLDAMNPPLERDLKKLSDSVNALLAIDETDRLPIIKPSQEAPEKKGWPLPTWATAILITLAVVIFGGIGIWAFSSSGTAKTSIIPTATTQPTDTMRPTDTEVVSAEASEESPFEISPTPNMSSDWQPLSFVVSNPNLWRVSGEGHYTAILDDSSDAFAWSKEKYDGDLKVSLDLNSPSSTQSVTPNSGCVIIYGKGPEFSYGSLIFCVDYDGYYLQKHTRYRPDEPLVFVPNDNEVDKVYSVTIEIIEDLISVEVNGEHVLASFFSLEEFDRKGRIGLFRNWAEGEITFSNLQVISTESGDQSDQADQSTPISTSELETDSAKQVLLITHPDCPPPKITTADEIIVRVRWGATTPEIAESNADQFTFLFLLNGEDFGDIRSYRQPAEIYSGFEEYGCGPDRSLGWVHWDVPIGRLPTGTHKVAVEHILDETISDGLDTYPAGSLGMFEINFEVQP